MFDQSSCHKAMAADALDATKMNVNPGGKQPVMRHCLGRQAAKDVFQPWGPKRHEAGL